MHFEGSVLKGLKAKVGSMWASTLFFDMCSQHHQASGFEIWIQDCMREWEL